MSLYQNNSYNGSYFSSLDRGYTPIPEAMEVVPEMSGLSPSSIGISAPPMQNQLEALNARIRQGASRVELGFTGRGKGSMGQSSTTPEMYGMEERRDIKELADFNKVVLSTHATTQIGNLSGLTEGSFNEQAREMALNEIKRAIDFAADVSHGGAVVVHTGEFQRPIFDNYGPDFMMNPAESDVGHPAHPEGERKKARFYLVDKRTGVIAQEVRTDQPVSLPIWKTDDKGNYVLDAHGNRQAETETDPQTGRKRYKTIIREWDYFVKETEKWNQTHPEEKRTPAIQYFIEKNDLVRLQYAGMSSFYGGIEQTEQLKEQAERLQKAIKFYEELEKTTPPEERWKLLVTHKTDLAGVPPPPPELQSEYLKSQLKNVQTHIQRMVYGEVTYTAQAKEIEEQQKNIVSIKDYAISKSADTIARAALFAMQKSEQMRTKEPLYVAPENIFPETYGSHPQELRTLIVESRKTMAERLSKMYGYEQKHADELAERHIKATFDIGHAYTWRKYFVGDPKASFEDNEKKFKHWLLNEVEKLANEGIIGHVHVSDNFGFEDEHVDPGMGRAPIKEFIEKIKKGGIKNVTVEPAHQDYRALLGGWRHFGSSIYGLSRPGGDTWSDVWRGYFGQTAPPYFLYGEAAPDQENWVLWSGSRME